MFRFLNKKLLYTVNYGKQINIKPQNYENLFTFISSIFSVFCRKYICKYTTGKTRDGDSNFRRGTAARCFRTTERGFFRYDYRY